jgi:cytoskeleton protein RodZ
MTTDKASQEADQPTVGERLRKAREVAGLSVAEVAAKQHLRPAVISAIESGDYRSIDSELFLKGYVRAYSGHVGIDPESVVRQLDKELEPLRQEQKALTEESPLVTIERRKRRKRQIARIVGVLAALAVLFYAGSLYLASQETTVDDSGSGETVTGGSEQAEAPPSEPSSDGLSMNTLGETGAETPEPAPEPLVEEPVAAESEAPEPAAPEAGGETVTGGQTDATSSAGEAGPLPEIARQPVSEPAPVVADSGAALSDNDDIPPGPESGGPVDNDGRLVVEFSGDCWVEVRDRDGRTLVAGLRRAGETLDVAGDGPLQVVIGAVSAVSALRYSGETVDLGERRTSRNRLELTLPD